MITPKNLTCDLMASYWTTAGAARPLTSHDFSSFDIIDRIRECALAGYTGIGFYIGDLSYILNKHSYSEIRQLSSEFGIRYVELEYSNQWFIDQKNSSDHLEFVIEAADKLRAHHIKACPPGLDDAELSLSKLRLKFSQFCERAYSHGVKVGLEIQAGSLISSVDSALFVVGDSHLKNGGLLLDIWHLARAGIPYDSILKIPRDKIVSVEINDADLAIRGTLVEDMLDNRKLCGQGQLNPASFIRCVQATGYDGPYSVEILSDELRRLPLREATRRTYNSAIRQFVNS